MPSPYSSLDSSLVEVRRCAAEVPLKIAAAVDRASLALDTKRDSSYWQQDFELCFLSNVTARASVSMTWTDYGLAESYFVATRDFNRGGKLDLGRSSIMLEYNALF
jgi:hypothetical protein